MANRFQTAVRESTDLIETGLELLDGVLRRVRASVQPEKDRHGVAMDATGPRNIDGAVSELANRIVRLAAMTPTDDASAIWSEVVEHVRECFAHVDGPRGFAGGVDVLLSTGTLAVQQALRGLAAHHAAPEGGFRRFVGDAAEILDDAQVYVTLQYTEQIERYRRRLGTNPDDHATRLRLGRTYIKCGLYHEAIQELLIAETDGATRFQALHELTVASFHCGRLADVERYATKAMRLDGSHPRTRLLLFLAADRRGGYSPSVPAEMRMQVRSGRHATTLKFVDVASRIGLDKTSGGRGTAVFDYDGDGWLDVLIAAAYGGCTLYRNNGDGTFTDVSIQSGLDTCLTAFATTIGDYDNDGRPDVFVTRNGFLGGDCSLYHNNGDGTFTDVTAGSGLEFWGPVFVSTWVDYDLDGWLDLYVVFNLGSLFERKTRNRLFHNNGDGTFTDVTDRAGLVTDWPTIGAAWGDYDNDGRPDLFISNAMGRSQLFHNNGDGTFTDVSERSGRDAYGIGSVCYWIDYDNDGWLDLVQNVWSDAEDAIHTLEHGDGPPDGHPVRLWRNNRDGTFSLRSRELGITGCWGTMSGNAADIDNDGHQDLVLGNGSPRMDRFEPLTLLQNDGRRFRDVTFSAGLPLTGKAHGVNIADLFGDGRMTIIVANGGAYPGDLMTVSAFCPTERPGPYLNVRLVGTRSNRSAIGARVQIVAGGRPQHRLVSGGSQFGCLPFEQHFGLGTLEAVDSIDIWWPSGLRQRLDGPIAANRTIRITEADDRIENVYPTR